MVKHALAAGEYNKRRAECETGVNHFARARPGVRSLRDVSELDLPKAGKDLPALIYRRCRHVITENARVLEAASALAEDDLDRFGQLMNESHRSLRDDYEVSCAELDLMVALAHRARGVFGARMTGGGFGGCTINLVNAENVDEFKRDVADGYRAETSLAPEIYVCSAAAGAGEIMAG
jgi:galactokinase